MNALLPVRLWKLRPLDVSPIDKGLLLDNLRSALQCYKIRSYAQRIGIIKAASDKNDGSVDLSLCAFPSC